MLNLLGKVLFQIGISLMTEEVMKPMIGNALDQWTKYTQTKVDDAIFSSVIKALRK